MIDLLLKTYHQNRMLSPVLYFLFITIRHLVIECINDGYINNLKHQYMKSQRYPAWKAFFYFWFGTSLYRTELHVHVVDFIDEDIRVRGCVSNAKVMSRWRWSGNWCKIEQFQTEKRKKNSLHTWCFFIINSSFSRFVNLFSYFYPITKRVFHPLMSF